MFRVMRNIIAATLLISSGSITQAMVYDNRFFPLFRPPYITSPGNPSHVSAELFIATAHRAFGEHDEEIGIPELFGTYDQHELARAIECTGKPNPLVQEFPGDIDLLTAELPWSVEGKIQAQGMVFTGRLNLGVDWLALGFSGLLMRVDSRQEFFSNCSDVKISAATCDELDALRRRMHKEIGLRCAHARQVGMGDFDIYVRFGDSWDYLWRCRRFGTGLTVGCFAPIGQVMDYNEAASVPFGGEGHWGVYGKWDLEIELKEDWKFGLLTQVSKRFKRTCVHRMPVCKEPQIFGAVVGLATVNPGITAVFSPYIMFENLRDGMGARVVYTLIEHRKDMWCDARDCRTVPVNLNAVQERSNWRSSYITLNVFYDFGKVKVIREFDPIFTFAWDVPVSFFDAHAVAKTQKVSLGFEFSF